MELRIKQISSLENVLMTDCMEQKKAVTRMRALKGERISYQIMVLGDYKSRGRKEAEVIVDSPLGSNVSVRAVEHVPVRMPKYNDISDIDYISDKPGLYPDVLRPLTDSKVFLHPYYASTLWVTAIIPADFDISDFNITTTIISGEKSASSSMRIHVIDKVLPQSDLIYTQWFHGDCIASYYNVPVFSEQHWKYLDSFIALAAHTGINMILTPIFTPALDTAIGGERPTIQLIDITKNGESYSFGYDKFERWVDMCRQHGIKYFEMAHLFTQWGAKYTPKIMVNVDGENKKLFGWHVEAMSEQYKDFLKQFLPSLISELKKLNIDKYTYFHISDEPSTDPVVYASYKAAKEFVAPLLKGFKIIDALSSPAYYDDGLVELPIPATNHIEPFLKRDLPERWCYYCCGQSCDVANRFIAMPSRRNRISGVQFYLFDIVGFLQWGYNFYYSAQSLRKIDPYQINDGDFSWPAGDPFSVYPDKDGAIESLRTVVFYEGLQDRMVLKLLEQKLGKEQVVQLIYDTAKEDITFFSAPKDNAFFTQLRENIYDLLDD